MESLTQDTLYLEVHSESDSRVNCPIQSAIAIFLASLCDCDSVHITLVRKENSEIHKSIPVGALKSYSVQRSSYNDIPPHVQGCTLPAVLSADRTSVRCGLCGILRHMLHLAEKTKPDPERKKLLGFKGNGLKACAEICTWTKFCEVEITDLVSRLMKMQAWNVEKDLLPTVMMFENHLKEPPILHNINKIRDAAIKKALKTTHIGKKESEIEDSSLPELQHSFAEGPEMTLTDILLFPCFHYILSELLVVKESLATLVGHCPTICKWFERVKVRPRIRLAASACGLEQLPPLDTSHGNPSPQGLPEIEKGVGVLSLCRDANPKKARGWLVDMVMKKLLNSKLVGTEDDHPVLPEKLRLNWDTLPEAINPKEGDLPKRRVQRKCEQVENLLASVRHLAKDGHTIVDFCSGGGHVGILLAYFLPKCNIILVENKEESIRRARNRIMTLGLKNVMTYQCNMDYFTGSFDIGVCLHACGVATDLVLQTCLDNRADFVICPCCYGSIKNTHSMSYPRSQAFHNSSLTYDDYLVLGHAADQTQFNIPQASKGKECMLLIDKDRALLAEEFGYQVTVCSLHPYTCSPKNNLIIGSRRAELIHQKSSGSK